MRRVRSASNGSPISGAPGRGALLQGIDEQAGVVGDLLGLVPVDAGDLAQHLGETGPAIAGCRREVGAAPERPRVAVEEHGERPTALLAERMQGAHVDGVDVGALLAVNLDVDEEVVHDGRSGRILEALVRHDVAPVAGGVADREQDGLARLLGLGQRLGAPRPPMHGIVLMLEQVRTGLAGQAIFAHDHWLLAYAAADHSREALVATGKPVMR
jgi:hypothetical protein